MCVHLILVFGIGCNTYIDKLSDFGLISDIGLTFRAMKLSEIIFYVNLLLAN